MTVVVIRGSSATSMVSIPPQDWPMTAIFVVSIFPRYSLSGREFSAMAQSMASISMSEDVDPEPPGRPLAITR
ncbi:hypothetical protein GCM10009716_39900 [Streptomyces sodiiphilus]|uniref:Uncharacterized protein n=1 Tax=Streptomyces sodiiphilus TaxID=226217 RepID=A0ABN2PRF5_9ACTN